MSAPETTSLLLEIGCEEIPARFLDGAERSLHVRLAEMLAVSRLLHPSVLTGPLAELPDRAMKSVKMQTYSTPRRLVTYVPKIHNRQPDHIYPVLGPSVKAAYDEKDKPTRAAESFAAKNNARVADLKRVTNARGEYVAVEVSEPGRSADEVLHEVLPAVIGSLSFPKNMYWTAKVGPLFVRPIRWILALLGEGQEAQVIPFEFAGVKSDQCTYGHRLKGTGPIRVTGFDDYLKKLREHWVEPDPSVRRERTKNGIKVLLEHKGSRAVTDEFLESWVVNSTEWPTPITGSFDGRYLRLPREVLVTVMRDHQKYFAVEDETGNLKPQFVTVLNVPGDPEGLIRQGHERVLAARFADAEFFWNADQKIALGNRIPMLKRVTYHAKLGTYADKVRRMKEIAEKICAELEKSGQISALEHQYALRAVELCKCDLTTQMVQEFTELQGIMGGLYAKSQGEPAEVADAIYDHYRPVSMEDSCPRSIVGAIVSLADKLDTVVAGFTAGLEPTGSSDPFGLRRAGNGAIKVSVEVLPGLNLQTLLRKALALDLELPPAEMIEEKISAFYCERLEFYLTTVARAKYDEARAVLKSHLAWAVPSQAVERAHALKAVRDSEDFEALSIAAKRTRNILYKSAELSDFGSSNAVQPGLLAPGPERDLYKAYLEMKEGLARYEADGDYGGAFRTLAGLRPKVDAFFDKVLVMDRDEKIRANRLRLLSELNALVFFRLADLSEIVPSSNMDAEIFKTGGRK